MINPRLEGLCSHPINAVVMTFLTHFIIDDVATTQTDLYKPLICNFLLRHIDTYLPNVELPKIKDLVDDLPPEVGDPFKKLCLLVYSSSIKNKQLFTANELFGHAVVVNDTLGLLSVRPRITMFGPERYYSFPHLSIQEFLAAVHLSKLSESDQTSAIKEVLAKNPLSQVLHFYAGLTNLSNKRALKVLSKALTQTVGNEAIMKEMRVTNDPRRKALAFFNCLFECQDESLLKLPETDLPVNRHIQQGYDNLQDAANLLPAVQPFHSLSLHRLALTPIDCISLGYYIHIKSITVPTSLIMAFDFFGCSIDHIGMRVLFTELKKNVTQRTKVRVQLVLAGNTFDKESLLSLKELLQGQSNLEALGLCKCFDPSVIDLCYALKCLIEGLSNNSSCGFIDLSANCFNSSHIYHFILMLRACPQIYWFDLKAYDLSRVMPLFCKAVVFSALHSLDISNCNISDRELVLLGKRIRISWLLQK